jgi:S-adenosylmethionine hydrolase
MSDPLVTLTTDFGTRSPYVAAMKGSLLSVCPHARLVDLSHEIPPQDVRHAAFFLAEAVPLFPAGTLHVVVVDPGVGSAREVLYIEVGGQRLLVPDNGCWSLLEAHIHRPLVRRVHDRRFWRHTVSATFHGRDIFAPVAGHLANGTPPEVLGPVAAEWVRLPWPEPQLAATEARGEVVFVDTFGNLISNLPGKLLEKTGASFRVESADVPRTVRTYAGATPGELVALVSSGGLVEVAVAQGSAAARLGAGVGASVLVRWQA